jgi:hypothetical protein
VNRLGTETSPYLLQHATASLAMPHERAAGFAGGPIEGVLK